MRVVRYKAIAFVLGSGACAIHPEDRNAIHGSDQVESTPGAAVSIGGPIGFVGIIIPHLVRLVVGPDHRLVLPAATLFGAAFLVGCDLVARTILAPIELPVGIITAIIGGPFFLWLLIRKP